MSSEYTGSQYEVTADFYESMGIQMPRIIKTPNYLKQKVGDDRIDVHQIQKCQEVLAAVEVDFTDEAEVAINKVRDLLKVVRGVQYGREEEYYQQIVDPIMFLKAGGGMFRYSTVYHVSNLMQSFLERMRRLDDDVLDILDAYENATRLCLFKCPKDTKNPIMRKLYKELESACIRYMDKADRSKSE